MKFLLYVYLCMSIATFIVYAIDKYKAQKGLWRTPEKTLHIMELCFGWPGAMMAHRFLRHKSYKKSFRIVFWCMVAINVAIVLLCLSKGVI